MTMHPPGGGPGAGTQGPAGSQGATGAAGPQGPAGDGTTDLDPFATVEDLVVTIPVAGASSSGTLASLGSVMFPARIAAVSLVWPAAGVSGSQDATNNWKCEVGKFADNDVDQTDTGAVFRPIVEKILFGQTGNGNLGENVRPHMAWTLDSSIFDPVEQLLMYRDTLWIRWTKNFSPTGNVAAAVCSYRLEPLR